MRKTCDEFYTTLKEWYPSFVETLNEITEYVFSTMEMENTNDVEYDVVWDGVMTMTIVGANDSICISIFGTKNDEYGVNIIYAIRNCESEQLYGGNRRFVCDDSQWIIQGIEHRVCEYTDAVSLKYSKEIQAILLSKMTGETMTKIVESCLTPEQVVEVYSHLNLDEYK